MGEQDIFGTLDCLDLKPWASKAHRDRKHPMLTQFTDLLNIYSAVSKAGVNRVGIAEYVDVLNSRHMNCE